MLKPTEASTQVALPFTIDETDFMAWLDSLPIDNEFTSCEQILQVLKTLNKTHQALASKTRLFFLNKLGQVLFRLTDQLTSATYNIEKTKAYLSIWSCSELANGYILLSEEKRFSNKDYYSLSEKIQIITFGLQAMAKALLYTSQSYSKPYRYFWIKCYQLYQIAQQQDLTTKPGDVTSKPYPNALAIDNAFKHILVFSLSNSNQFTPQEMKLIYELLDDYATHTKFLYTVPEKKFTGIPYLNFKNDLPPALSYNAEPVEDEHTLYVATVSVAGKILEYLADKSQSFAPSERALLLRLARLLTLNRHRKHPREPDKSHHFGVIGFTNLVSFFYQHRLESDEAVAVGQLDLNRPGELRELNFEILPHEKNLDPFLTNTYSAEKIKQQLQANPAEIWDNDKKTHFEANATQIDKSQSGFGLIWQDKNTEPRVGDVIGLQNQNPSIGFIRWIAQSPTAVLLFGVERLGFNAQAVKVTNTGFPDIQIDAIHLITPVHTANPSESIIINDAFTPTEFIFVHYPNSPVRYRVDKQLHSTSLLNHIEIVQA